MLGICAAARWWICGPDPAKGGSSTTAAAPRNSRGSSGWRRKSRRLTLTRPASPAPRAARSAAAAAAAPASYASTRAICASGKVKVPQPEYNSTIRERGRISGKPARMAAVIAVSPSGQACRNAPGGGETATPAKRSTGVARMAIGSASPPARLTESRGIAWALANSTRRARSGGVSGASRRRRISAPLSSQLAASSAARRKACSPRSRARKGGNKPRSSGRSRAHSRMSATSGERARCSPRLISAPWRRAARSTRRRECQGTRASGATAASP